MMKAILVALGVIGAAIVAVVMYMHHQALKRIASARRASSPGSSTQAIASAATHTPLTSNTVAPNGNGDGGENAATVVGDYSAQQDTPDYSAEADAATSAPEDLSYGDVGGDSWPALTDNELASYDTASDTGQVSE